MRRSRRLGWGTFFDVVEELLARDRVVVVRVDRPVPVVDDVDDVVGIDVDVDVDVDIDIDIDVDVDVFFFCSRRRH